MTPEEKREAGRLAWRRWVEKSGNAEKNQENVRKWQEDNKEHRAAWRKEWRASPNGKLYLQRRRLRAYGLTLEQHADLLVHQADRCGGCGVEISAQHHIDHDHVSGAVRGLLCRGCNHALGQTGDNPDVLRALASYLEAPPASTLAALRGLPVPGKIPGLPETKITVC